jgi:hypothetical protein
MLSTAFGENWTQYLQVAIFSYNAAICRNTGFSPYFLMHGRDPALLEEITLPSPFAGDKAFNQPVTDMSSITKRLKALWRTPWPGCGSAPQDKGNGRTSFNDKELLRTSHRQGGVV